MYSPVRQDSVVRGGPLGPRVYVVEDPIVVRGVARSHEGVCEKRGGCQIQRDVALRHALVHRVEDAREHGVVAPIGGRAGHAGNVVVREAEHRVAQHPTMGGPILGRHLESWAATAIDWTSDQAMLGIVIRRIGIFPRVEPREPDGALPVPQVVRLREPEEVEVQVAFAVVHPIVVGIEFTV